MTGSVVLAPQAAWPWRLIGGLRDIVVGSLLCLTPITAILALGWIARRMAYTIDRHWGIASARPGWVLGPIIGPFFARLLGGFAANVRSGFQIATGLFVVTLPFTLAWLGSWWAGWENSFNKGYEQAAVGPLVWGGATLLSLPILAHLPLALAHAAAEGRLGAFFEWRRIRSVGAAAGWKLAWLALLSALVCLPMFALRALPVFIEGIVPDFVDMSGTEQAEVVKLIDLVGAILCFTAVYFLRHRACVIYARAAPNAAAGRFAELWADHRVVSIPPSNSVPPRFMSLFWLVTAGALWLVMPLLIVAGQFMNYDPVRWLAHPVLTLPWAG